MSAAKRNQGAPERNRVRHTAAGVGGDVDDGCAGGDVGAGGGGDGGADVGGDGDGDGGAGATRGEGWLELPPGLVLQRTTPTFTAESTPRGLRNAHAVARGVWGRLIVSSGSLGFVFEDAPDDVRTVHADDHQVIPPERLHHVVIDGPVEFAVEFHR